MSYTKGVWRISKNGVCDNVKEMNIAFIDHQSIITEKTHQITKNESESNAKIMCASPELLEALMAIRDLLNENEPQWYLKKHFNQINSAIKKATE